MLWCLDILLKESVDWKINTSIWFHCMKKKSLMEDKKGITRRRGPTLIRTPKKYGEFVIVL